MRRPAWRASRVPLADYRILRLAASACEAKALASAEAFHQRRVVYFRVAENLFAIGPSQLQSTIVIFRVAEIAQVIRNSMIE